MNTQTTDLDIKDNTASAFTISEGANNYFLLTTTNGAPVVTLDTLEAGGTMNVGVSNVARTINLGTGTGIDTINIGTGGTGADVIISALPMPERSLSAVMPLWLSTVPPTL